MVWRKLEWRGSREDANGGVLGRRLCRSGTGVLADHYEVAIRNTVFLNVIREMLLCILYIAEIT